MFVPHRSTTSSASPSEVFSGETLKRSEHETQRAANRSFLQTPRTLAFILSLKIHGFQCNYTDEEITPNSLRLYEIELNWNERMGCGETFVCNQRKFMIIWDQIRLCMSVFPKLVSLFSSFPFPSITDRLNDWIFGWTVPLIGCEIHLWCLLLLR